MNRLERLYAVTEEIRRRAPAPVRAAWLAERFGVTRRTMERDLAALFEAGVPLQSARGRGGGHALDPRAGRTALTLSAAEVTALLLALTAANGMPYAQAAETATRRLTDALPPATRVSVDRLRVGFAPCVRIPRARHLAFRRWLKRRCAWERSSASSTPTVMGR